MKDEQSLLHSRLQDGAKVQAEVERERQALSERLQLAEQEKAGLHQQTIASEQRATQAEELHRQLEVRANHDAQQWQKQQQVNQQTQQQQAQRLQQLQQQLQQQQASHQAHLQQLQQQQAQSPPREAAAPEAHQEPRPVTPKTPVQQAAASTAPKAEESDSLLNSSQVPTPRSRAKGAAKEGEEASVSRRFDADLDSFRGPKEARGAKKMSSKEIQILQQRLAASALRAQRQQATQKDGESKLGLGTSFSIGPNAGAISGLAGGNAPLTASTGGTGNNTARLLSDAVRSQQGRQPPAGAVGTAASAAAPATQSPATPSNGFAAPESPTHPVQARRLASASAASLHTMVQTPTGSYREAAAAPMFAQVGSLPSSVAAPPPVAAMAMQGGGAMCGPRGHLPQARQPSSAANQRGASPVQVRLRHASPLPPGQQPQPPALSSPVR